MSELTPETNGKRIESIGPESHLQLTKVTSDSKDSGIIQEFQKDTDSLEKEDQKNQTQGKNDYSNYGTQKMFTRSLPMMNEQSIKLSTLENPTKKTDVSQGISRNNNEGEQQVTDEDDFQKGGHDEDQLQQGHKKGIQKDSYQSRRRGKHIGKIGSQVNERISSEIEQQRNCISMGQTDLNQNKVNNQMQFISDAGEGKGDNMIQATNGEMRESKRKAVDKQLIGKISEHEGTNALIEDILIEGEVDTNMKESRDENITAQTKEQTDNEKTKRSEIRRGKGEDSYINKRDTAGICEHDRCLCCTHNVDMLTVVLFVICGRGDQTQVFTWRIMIALLSDILLPIILTRAFDSLQDEIILSQILITFILLGFGLKAVNARDCSARSVKISLAMSQPLIIIFKVIIKCSNNLFCREDQVNSEKYLAHRPLRSLFLAYLAKSGILFSGFVAYLTFISLTFHNFFLSYTSSSTRTKYIIVFAIYSFDLLRSAYQAIVAQNNFTTITAKRYALSTVSLPSNQQNNQIQIDPESHDQNQIRQSPMHTRFVQHPILKDKSSNLTYSDKHSQNKPKLDIQNQCIIPLQSYVPPSKERGNDLQKYVPPSKERGNDLQNKPSHISEDDTPRQINQQKQRPQIQSKQSNEQNTIQNVSESQNTQKNSNQCFQNQQIQNHPHPRRESSYSSVPESQQRYQNESLNLVTNNVPSYSQISDGVINKQHEIVFKQHEIMFKSNEIVFKQHENIIPQSNELSNIIPLILSHHSLSLAQETPKKILKEPQSTSNHKSQPIIFDQSFLSKESKNISQNQFDGVKQFNSDSLHDQLP